MRREGLQLPGEGEEEKAKRQKKELEEKEAHEAADESAGKPRGLGFLAVESEPDRPSGLAETWANTKKEPEEDEPPSGPDDQEAPPITEYFAAMPQDEAMPQPATEEIKPPEPAAEEDEAPPAHIIEEPAEAPAVPEEPVAESADEDDDADAEPELPAPQPEPEASPSPEPKEEEPPKLEEEPAPAAEPEAIPEVEEPLREEPDETVPAEADDEDEPAREDEPVHEEAETADIPAEEPAEEELNIDHTPEIAAVVEDEDEPEIPGEEADAEVPDAEPEAEPDADEELDHVESEEDAVKAEEPPEVRPFTFVEGEEEKPEIEEAQPAAEQAKPDEGSGHDERGLEEGRGLKDQEAGPDSTEHEKLKPFETAVAPETSRSSRAAEQKMKLESAPKGPLAGRRIETLNREELMQIARSIDIEGNNLFQIFETHLIGERGLRRLLIEYQKGNNLSEALKREVLEHELDFERDPAMRNPAPPSVTSQDSPASKEGFDSNPTLEKLLKKADVGVDDNSKTVFEKGHKRYEAVESGKHKRRYRALADAVFFIIIGILALLVVIIYLRRG